MAKKRVFLDECCGDDGLKSCFPSKASSFVAADFGLRGKEDPPSSIRLSRKNASSSQSTKISWTIPQTPPRKGRKLPFFYGLIFLKASKVKTRREQLQAALKAIDWGDTRDHDDLIFVSAQGKTRHERLCHPECAAEFPADQGEWG